MMQLGNPGEEKGVSTEQCPNEPVSKVRTTGIRSTNSGARHATKALSVGTSTSNFVYCYVDSVKSE